jgi:catechol 2,3-dioxygenase-like lactoylglutathione lyase family enzyme
MSVPARINIVTLGVDSVTRSKAFYEALGWELAGSVGDEICWFRTSDSYLGLFGREASPGMRVCDRSRRRSSVASPLRSTSGARRKRMPRWKRRWPPELAS